MLINISLLNTPQDTPIMSTWTNWLFSGGEERTSSESNVEKKEEKKEDEAEEGWKKGLEIAEGWVQSVASYASNIGDSVKKQVTETANAGILGDFQKEQEAFERKQRHEKDAAVAPWVGYNEEEQIRAQVLELSADSRNFLREPPHGVDFPFDYSRMSPVAMVMLNEDIRLQKLRFELVPKKVSEESFWRNYFYRVSLIKQSVQLSTLSAAESPKPVVTSVEPRLQPDSSNKATSADKPVSDMAQEKKDEEAEHVPPSEGEESVEEFASDQLYNSNTVSKETVKSELDQLGVSKEEKETLEEQDNMDDGEMWDELKAELEELDLGEGGGEGDVPPDWEQELQDMLQEDLSGKKD